MAWVAPHPLFGQSPKQNMFFLMMSSLICKKVCPTLRVRLVQMKTMSIQHWQLLFISHRCHLMRVEQNICGNCGFCGIIYDTGLYQPKKCSISGWSIYFSIISTGKSEFILAQMLLHNFYVSSRLSITFQSFYTVLYWE